ncbi:hypothetical protein WR25_18688 [Diploscapter pachys]|uniref:Uncharacterized protein n=1 Tax=Diploscapter pachys TaxID=2018661 RepID=A0A2A2KQW8_9BILA|nr:hypothetical protein WR25_18688 [Diploscapter pachys]
MSISDYNPEYRFTDDDEQSKDNGNGNGNEETPPDPELLKKLDNWKMKLHEEADRIIAQELPKKVNEFDAMLKDKRLGYKNMRDIIGWIDAIFPIPKERKHKYLFQHGNASSCSSSTSSISTSTSNSQENAGKEKVGKKTEKSDKEPRTPNPRREKVRAPKVHMFASGPIDVSHSTCDISKEFELKLRECVEMFNTVRMSITFRIPRIQDGNNFGIEIQEKMRLKVSKCEDKTLKLLGMLGQYHLCRASLIIRIYKKPWVLDYRKAFADSEAMQINKLRLSLNVMHYNMWVLHDKLTKNMEKIKKPRKPATNLMYD